MSVDIKSKTDNKLLSRKEIEAEVTFDGPTPKREELRQAISAKIGANPDLTVLREVKNTYGRKAVSVVAHAYSSKETLMQTEPEHIRRRDGVGVEKKEEKPKEEPKKEEAKEEKPKEAPKEEPKKEEAKEEKPKEAPKEEPKKEEKPKEEPKTKEAPKKEEKSKEAPKKEE
jgi:ribosomal protein S24E